jgi:hypothetical protein
MPGDYSRKTFEPEKHYSGVLMQQGRVQLDADWNEQWDLGQHRLKVETIDVIGSTGVPKKGESFLIGIAPDGADLLILPGRIYVDGLLFELGHDYCPATYFHQPYYPDPDSQYFLLSPPDKPPCSPPIDPRPDSPLSPPAEIGGLDLHDGTYIVYLDGWQREVTYLEDSHIQEVALGGGVDTTTRVQNVWQVKLLRVSPEGKGTIDCDSPFQEWSQLISSGQSGMLQARTNPAAVETNPCCLPPSAGYLGLENQLYRVEVHTGGDIAAVTFKWSRENASVATAILDVDGNTLTLADLGKDLNVLNIGPNQWVEIIDGISELQGTPNDLVQIKDFGRSPNTVVLTTDATAYKGRPNLRLRRWDQTVNTAGPQGLSAGTAGNFIDLENGIQVAFGDGQYNPGEYWLIPARVATAAIEWPFYPKTNVPVLRPPVGTRHHFCKLALITAKSGQVDIQDCRPLFPSLTGICAEDICFDNGTCDLSDARNVQEALDLLCAANDLREHNKYLHGWGVVCGLTVNCEPKRRSVLINPGYALDCNGNVIKTNKAFTYPILDSPVVAKAGDGKYLLSLSGSSQNPVVAVETYTPKSFLDEILDGTLIKDYFDKYILGLIQFAETELGMPLTAIAPVPIGQRKLTSLLNGLAQMVNAASGRYIFVSGTAHGSRADCTALTNTSTEDELLFCLYNDLKAEIASKTFCAMFDGDRGFPDYKLNAGLTTIFGTPLKVRDKMQVSNDGKYAYVIGKIDNNICIYDLTTGQLVQILNFGGDPNVKWQDIAVEPNFTHLFVVGMTGSSSLFAVIDRNDATNPVHSWGWSGTVNNVSCVRLRCSDRGKPFGIFLGQGLYNLHGLGAVGFKPTLVGKKLNTTGLLTLVDDNGALVSVNSTGAKGTSFDQLVFIQNGSQVAHSFSGDANNDDMVTFGNAFYCTGTDNAGGRVIGGLEINAAQEKGASLMLNAINDTSSIMRIGPSATTDNPVIFVTCSETCRVLPFRVEGPVTYPLKHRIPVQLTPMAIVIGEGNKKGYVLNAVSSTITVMNFATIYKGGDGRLGFFGNSQPNYTKEPPAVLATYHTGVHDAFADVLSHLLQYLKDSFCGEFLIDCPDCTGEEKIYLGSVEIRDKQVYRICNFTKRKYVKTFRTVDWWLSVVPILPLMKQALINFCCPSKK